MGPGCGSSFSVCSRRLTAGSVAAHGTSDDGGVASSSRDASLPAHFTMHSFRVGGSLSKSLADMPVDEILPLGGWRTEVMARHYIWATTSEAVDVSQTVDQLYDHVDTWSASSDFQERYAACGSRYNSAK